MDRLSEIKKRLSIALLAIKESGSLFRGLGEHVNQIKINLLNLRPSTMIIPLSILFFDGLLSVLSFFLSIFIVVGNDFFEYSHAYILKNMVVFLCTSLSVFLWMQIHKTLWRYFSLEDCVPLSLAVLLTTLLYLPMMILLSFQEALPKSVPFINFMIYLCLLCLARYLYRTMYEHRLSHKKHLLQDQAVPVLLVGTGYSTELFIREIMHSPALSFAPVGIISPNVREKGRRIHTVQILGGCSDVDSLMSTVRSLPKRPSQIIITETDLTDTFLEAIVTFSQRSGLPIMQMISQFTITKKSA